MPRITIDNQRIMLDHITHYYVDHRERAFGSYVIINLVGGIKKFFQFKSDNYGEGDDKANKVIDKLDSYFKEIE